jgi:cytochrome c oxidase assembly protein subunit 15
MFALVLLCYTFWFALKLLIPDSKRIFSVKQYRFSIVLLLLLALQLMYGAFMAGLKAAPVAATWPDVNGTYLPEHISQFGATTYSGIHILTDQPIVVHYIHRSLAYLLLTLILIWFMSVRKLTKANLILRKASVVTLLIISLQVLLGILTVLNGHLMTQSKFLRFELLAELHQMVAILLLMNWLVNFYLFKRK